MVSVATRPLSTSVARSREARAAAALSASASACRAASASATPAGGKKPPSLTSPARLPVPWPPAVTDQHHFQAGWLGAQEARSRLGGYRSSVGASLALSGSPHGAGDLQFSLCPEGRAAAVLRQDPSWAEVTCASELRASASLPPGSAPDCHLLRLPPSPQLLLQLSPPGEWALSRGAETYRPTQRGTGRTTPTCDPAAQQRVCEQAVAHVETTLYLTPCLNDCGPYGQCLLLRRYGYLYAGCSCKAGWRGWSCTDNSTAQTVAQQRTATLLLTLSNLMFLAPIALSVHRSFLVEAAVYFYTMFFSTFYHACDQPGEAVLCIFSYDTLQYCDFLGSGASIWVTILCMARLKTILKQVLLVLGTLVIAMSLQLDRRAIWNLMGPCLFAFVIMVCMWVYRCAHRRQCYPTSWQRWVFYLLPGISMASVGIAIYTSMMTSDNYYYTHSIWHILLAGSAAFLLPPREEQAEPWACLQKFPCNYQICRNDRDELYAVT